MGGQSVPNKDTDKSSFDGNIADFYTGEQWMEWQTYKWCRFHRSGRGSLARRRRARPRERRPSRHDSETPLCHTRWRLRWQEQKSGEKRGKCSMR